MLQTYPLPVAEWGQFSDTFVKLIKASKYKKKPTKKEIRATHMKTSPISKGELFRVLPEINLNNRSTIAEKVVNS